MEFSIRKMKEVIKEETEKRVSKEAAEEFSQDLEMHGHGVTMKALDYTRADGRITVRAEDVRKAINEVNNQ